MIKHKTFFLITLSLLILTAKCFGDQKQSKDENDSGIKAYHIITLYPVNLMLSNLKIGEEFLVSQNHGLKFYETFGYYENKNHTNSNFYGMDQFSKFVLEVQYKVYLSQKPDTLCGFYIGPDLQFSSMTYTTTGQSASGATEFDPGSESTFIASLLFGYQHIYRSHFTIDIFVGAGYNFAPVNNFVPGNTSIFGTGLMPRGDIAMGFAF